MNKNEEYLKFYIESNANIDLINKYIKNEHITLNEYNDIVTGYLKELKQECVKDKHINKLYLEYTLKYGNKIVDTKKVSKRKFVETIINLINNYIKEDKHNIKEYINNYNLEYIEFKKFINNYKNYYLKENELETLKIFLKRENDFNNSNLDKIKELLDKISDDLVNDKKFTIFNYYQFIKWDSKLLLYYLKNNKGVFSDFIIDNVNIYVKKHHLNSKNYKLKEFIEYIKDKNSNIKKETIEKIINYMNENKMPYNYYLFLEIKKEIGE